MQGKEKSWRDVFLCPTQAQTPQQWAPQYQASPICQNSKNFCVNGTKITFEFGICWHLTRWGLEVAWLWLTLATIPSQARPGSPCWGLWDRAGRGRRGGPLHTLCSPHGSYLLLLHLSWAASHGDLQSINLYLISAFYHPNNGAASPNIHTASSGRSTALQNLLAVT